MKKALVLGAGGFIGSHLAKRLKQANYFVKGIDLKHPEFGVTACDEFVIGDLRNFDFCQNHITKCFDEVYQLAADMGGAGYIFTGDNDFNVMLNSASININVANLCVRQKIGKVFYSSSACVYAKCNQQNSDNPLCEESSAYPAEPDSEYGWEKLFSERIYLAANRNYGLQVRVARLHNVYGPEGAWNNGKEKAPAALCRKVAEVDNGGEVEIWGNGSQTRSFLYIDDCLEGIIKLMESNFVGPVNIGSEEMISINNFARLIANVAGKEISIKNIEGPVGVNGRCSHNKLVKEKINWEPVFTLQMGIAKTYNWINGQLKENLQTSSNI